MSIIVDFINQLNKMSIKEKKRIVKIIEKSYDGNVEAVDVDGG